MNRSDRIGQSLGMNILDTCDSIGEIVLSLKKLFF